MANSNPSIPSAHHLQILNAIARALNGAVELQSILDIALGQTVELLNLQTGWVWLVNPGSRSVYLAASHHLPPALAQHPERLSGWCYCIDKYLASHLEEAINISDITCTRLKDLTEGTDGIKYHASIPLLSGRQKVGIMNVVHPKSEELDESQLKLLYTIGDLLGMAIGRTHQYENSRRMGAVDERKRLSVSLKKHLLNGIDALELKNKAMQAWLESGDKKKLENAIRQSKQLLEEIKNMTERSLSDLDTHERKHQDLVPIKYPTVPLTDREMEVLQQLQKGRSNKEIATVLFISERTVKFHVSAILQKLNATNRTEAVQIAMQRGILFL
ncbi:MAG: LuxR C-terminal-related transcriptional regulator [Bacteroidota bacterium]